MVRTFILGSVIIAVLASSSSAFGQEQAEKDYETAMTLGNFQLETGEYANAIANFKHALEIKPADKTALVSLGIAYSRSGDMSNARDTLQQALAVDPADARTKYELGIVLFKVGDREGAKGQFAAVSSGPAGETLKASAHEYLDMIASGAGPEKKRFSLNALAGAQYDSNVILDPDNPVVPGLKKADWRFIATLGGAYQLIDKGKTTADAGYSFYQGLNDTLTDFNVQQHTVTLSGRYNATEKSRFDLRYEFLYSLVGGDKYSAVHQVKPSADFSFTKDTVTEFFYSYENKKFYDSGLFPTNTDRNGNNNAGGLTHTIVLSKQSAVTAGYAYDRDSTDTDFWNYTGNKGFLSFQSKLFDTGIALSASYYDKKYGGVPPGFTEKRQDSAREYSAALDRRIARNVNLNLSDLYVQNRSNLSLYEYRRNLVSLTAVMHL
jgi:tetratricopeptide (TPR) repeat protein